jgi:hypothetical protein
VARRTVGRGGSDTGMTAVSLQSAASNAERGVTAAVWFTWPVVACASAAAISGKLIANKDATNTRTNFMLKNPRNAKIQLRE